MTETLELLHPTNWMIVTALIAVGFLLNRQWVHGVMMVLCFGGWMAARAGLRLGEGEGPIIPLHWVILVPAMAALGAATVTLVITGVLTGLGALFAKRLKEEREEKEAAKALVEKRNVEVEGSAG